MSQKGLSADGLDSLIANIAKAAKELRAAQQANVLDGQRVDLGQAARSQER